MPTFDSIPIHPFVKARFVGSQRQDDNADDCERHHRQQQQHHQQQLLQRRRQPARSGVSIPRSLLTRDLNDLVDMVSRGEIRNESQRGDFLVEMESIRYRVAGKMLSRTRNGKRLISNCERDRKHKKYRTLISVGSISVQDAWESQQKMANKQQNFHHVYSTGCSNLDDLIAFPSEYFSQLNGNQNVTMSCYVDSISGEAKGLPTGYLLKLSGTSGKTQLAIQLASEAIIHTFQTSIVTKKRIRYCYSTAGHSGYALAQRLFQVIRNKTDYTEEKVLKDMVKTVEFQPIKTLSQLVSSMAKLEKEFSQNAALESSSENKGVSNDKVIAEKQGMVSMLVVDAMPLMIFEGEDAMKIDSLERWLKRLARHYSVLVVIVATSGGGRLSSIQNNKTTSDIHLQLQKTTSTTLSIRLMRHPAKPVTEKDCITCHLR